MRKFEEKSLRREERERERALNPDKTGEKFTYMGVGGREEF